MARLRSRTQARRPSALARDVLLLFVAEGKPMKRLSIFVLLLLPITAPAQPARRAMVVDDLFRFKRLADPHISPDGKWVAYAVGTVDMENNRVVYNLWLASAE